LLHNSILSLFSHFDKPAAKILRRRSEGAAEGGCGGNSAAPEPEPRRPARSEQNTNEKFCFPFRRKNRPRTKSEMRTKLFIGVASVSEQRRGGAS